MEDKNVPCPFCEETEALEINHKLKAIECGGCGAIAPTSMYEPEDLDPYFEDIERRWNSRPIEDALTATIAQKDAEIERLRAMFKKIYNIPYLNLDNASCIAEMQDVAGEALEVNYD